VADLPAPAWREDVRGFKLTIATESNTFRERLYELANWGLGESAAA